MEGKRKYSCRRTRYACYERSWLPCTFMETRVLISQRDIEPISGISNDSQCAVRAEQRKLTLMAGKSTRNPN